MRRAVDTPSSPYSGIRFISPLCKYIFYGVSPVLCSHKIPQRELSTSCSLPYFLLKPRLPHTSHLILPFHPNWGHFYCLFTEETSHWFLCWPYKLSFTPAIDERSSYSISSSVWPVIYFPDPGYSDWCKMKFQCSFDSHLPDK